jgi:hypothetical protein
MSGTLVIAGKELSDLAALAVEMGRSLGSPVLVETSTPVDDLTKTPRREASALVVFLTGRENVGDLLSMFRANRGVPALLLSPSYPPDGAVARIVAQNLSTVLPAGTPALLIAATVVALLSSHTARSL